MKKSMSSAAQILQPTPENIRIVAQALRAGEIAGIPTETVYGLAGHALEPSALAKIFAAKERPTFDPLIVHVSNRLLQRKSNDKSSGALEALANSGLVNLEAMNPLARDRAETLIQKFWPGPLTLVLPKLPGVPDLATAGLPSIAIRMPQHPVAQALLEDAGIPLAAPSANRFGRISPTQASHVFEELGERISWILDGGPCEIGVESTVLSISKDGSPSLLRPGGISRQEIEALLKTPVAIGISGEKQGAAIAQGSEAAPAPGMLDSHYAPEKPLFLLTRPFSDPNISQDPVLQKALSRNSKIIGLLLMAGLPQDGVRLASQWTPLPVHAVSLSPSGDLAEMAKNLFSALRELDHSDADILIAEPCSNQQGLGHAISDRIRRASLKRI
jgi:L-threonylcarbamoyladenylate synthase